MSLYAFDNTKTTTHKEYFSGANVKVYFGDIWIDQLTSIQFELQEQISAIYGFHSYTFDKMARGSRIVQGAFTLNFTENGYLQTILNRLASEVRTANESDTYRDGFGSAANFAANRYSAAQTIDQILAADSSSASYQDYIDSLKDSFWGASSDTDMVNAGVIKDENPYFYANQNGYTDNPLRENGFNITIDFNPEANDSDLIRYLQGTTDTNPASDASQYNTYCTIVGVHLGNVSVEIGNDGRPLTQRFQFLARDLDGDITTASLKNSYRYDIQTY